MVTSAYGEDDVERQKYSRGMPLLLPTLLGAGEAGLETVDIGGRTVGAEGRLYDSSRGSGATVITPI